MNTRVCEYCREDLPETTEYFYLSKGKFDNRCKECRHILYLLNSDSKKISAKERYKRKRELILTQATLHYEQNREQILEYKKKTWSRNKEKKRVYRLEKKFLVSEQTLRDIMDSQKGCCDICGITLVSPESIRSFAVDHDHATGDVRGLLCNNCNTAIGLFLDNIEILKSAIKYLDKNNVAT